MPIDREPGGTRSSLPELQPTVGLDLKPIPYGLITRLVDRFHGWWDGVQRQPDVSSAEIRTPYWNGLEHLGRDLFEKERARFKKEIADDACQFSADDTRLAQTNQALGDAERELGRAEQDLLDGRDRLDNLRNPQVRESDDDRIARKRQLRGFTEHVTSANQIVRTLTATRDRLEVRIKQIDVKVKVHASVAQAKGNLAWYYAAKRQDVYRQALVRSHPHGTEVNTRLSALVLGPPPALGDQ